MTPYVKAAAVGTLTGFLALVVVAGVLIVAFSGIAATGGGGIAGVSVGGALLFLPLVLVLAGFIAGFAWTLRRARHHGHG